MATGKRGELASYPFADRPKLLGATEAAKRIGASRDFIYDLMDAGRISYVRLPSSKDGGRCTRRIREDVLYAWIDENTVPERVA